MPARECSLLASGHHERVHAPIAVVGPNFRGELCVEPEAGPSEGPEGRAVAPVERQESARLARGGAGHARALDHGDGHTASSQEIRDRRADDAGAADDDVPRRRHWAYATRTQGG